MLCNILSLYPDWIVPFVLEKICRSTNLSHCPGNTRTKSNSSIDRNFKIIVENCEQIIPNCTGRDIKNVDFKSIIWKKSVHKIKKP